MTDLKKGYQHEEKMSGITLVQTYGVWKIFHEMKISRNKRNILFLRQGIEEVFIDDLNKALEMDLNKTDTTKISSL